MMPFTIRHLLESTLFCLLLFALGACLKKRAAARYTLGLAGICKFAIPSLLLMPTGARLAFFWPATPWLSSVVNKMSAALTQLEGMLPGSIPPGTSRMLAFAWAIGAASMVGLWFVRFTRLRPQLTVPSGEEEGAMAQAIASLPGHPSVRIRLSGTCDEPALRGIIHPVITVPSGLSKSLTASEFQSVLLHELAHARRLDNLAAVFVHCLVCVFWFHPLLWLLERRLNADRERACDELVLACGMKPDVYASGILKVRKFHLLGTTAAGVSAISGSDLRQRLELILEAKGGVPLSYVPRVLIAALAILMTIVPLAGGYCSQCVSNGQQSAGGPSDPPRLTLPYSTLSK